MYVRDARKRDEAWLLDHIEELGLDDATFRSREFVVAVDETTDERAGFGRLRSHPPADPDALELTSLGVSPAWQGQGVGAHVVERLVSTAEDNGFDVVYALIDEPTYLTQFGFEPVDRSALPEPIRDRLATKREGPVPDAIGMRIAVDEFEMPERLRERFKSARPQEEDPEDVEELASDLAEDFGIDTEQATYKYDTGRR